MNIKKILYAQKYHYSAVSKMLEMVVKKVNQNEIINSFQNSFQTQITGESFETHKAPKF